MDILVVDQEMICAGKMISSNMEEIMELNSRLYKALNGLTRNGFIDQEISSALSDKADAISDVVQEVYVTTQNVLAEIQNYIEEIDEKDKYLY